MQIDTPSLSLRPVRTVSVFYTRLALAPVGAPRLRWAVSLPAHGGARQCGQAYISMVGGQKQ